MYVCGFACSLRVALPSLPSTYSAAIRSASASAMANPVSVICSGPRMRRAKKSSSDWPETTSTTRPSTSVDTE